VRRAGTPPKPNASTTHQTLLIPPDFEIEGAIDGVQGAPLEVALATGPGADAVINLMGRAAYSGGV